MLQALATKPTKTLARLSERPTSPFLTKTAVTERQPTLRGHGKAVPHESARAVGALRPLAPLGPFLNWA